MSAQSDAPLPECMNRETAREIRASQHTAGHTCSSKSDLPGLIWRKDFRGRPGPGPGPVPGRGRGSPGPGRGRGPGPGPKPGAGPRPVPVITTLPRVRHTSTCELQHPPVRLGHLRQAGVEADTPSERFHEADARAEGGKLRRSRRVKAECGVRSRIPVWAHMLSGLSFRRLANCVYRLIDLSARG